MDLQTLDQMPPEVYSELRGDEDDPFDMRRLHPIVWSPKDSHVILRGDDGRPVATAGTVVADIEVSLKRFAVVGLGGVLVKREHRGRGFARTVVTAALEQAASRGPDFATLFCLEDRVGLYLKLGFEPTGGPTTVDQPDGPIEVPMTMMWRAYRAEAVWPDGPVTVLGLPY